MLFYINTEMHQLCIFIIISLFLAQYQAAYGLSDPSEVASLMAIKDKIGDGLGKLSNWIGSDACGTLQWTGVHCSTIDGVQYIHELRLLDMNFTGTLAPDVGNLTHLTILNFMWNKLTGPVPSTIGKLSNLYLLLFDGNDFTGSLPPELGNLSKLNRLQIDGNNLTGPLPPSFQGLTAVKHIHLNNNSLSGNIPSELGKLPSLLHLLLDNNNLSGELPPELSDISPLVILQLDNNNFSGGIPSSYTTLVNLTKLSLRNCNLSGVIPDLSSLPYLQYLDLSQNRFNGSLPTLNSTSQPLTTIDLSFNNLDGELPVDYLQMLNLELLLLQNNSLIGSIPVNRMNHNAFSSKSVLIVNLQNNNFSEFIPGGYSSLPNITFRLYGNAVCANASGNVPPNSCLEKPGSDFNFSTIPADTRVLVGCSESTCDQAHNQELVSGLLSLGQCHCAYPLVVGYRLKSPSFTIFPPYESGFYTYVASGMHLQDYQIHVKEVSLEPGPRLRMTIKLFPSSDTNQFEAAEVEYLYSMFSNWSAPPNNTFGPYELLYFTIGYPYDGNLSSGTNGKSLSGGAIAGILVATVALTAIVVAAIMFLVGKRRQKYVVTTKSVRQTERIKVAGVRSFSFQEMAKATNKFDISMALGQGGYGKVYKAVLDDGLVVAIKRAEDGSLQGSKEFFTEIDLLSRLHHRNLVSLIGYCDDEGEQMLVYEFMENGSVQDHLNSGSKVPLDFPARLQIAIGAAKGILYLHAEANPPIYHRDIKASNILLDDKMRAKVADFGLSKLAPLGDVEGEAGGYVSTMVKGTPGYLDPEYFFTHQLTDKSDVYSFGVVLLELVTGRQPIYYGKNLVREVTQEYEAGNVLSMVDPRMGMCPTECILPLIQLAISCSQDEMEPRPSMAEVVRVLVSIWQSTPMRDSSLVFSEASMDIQAIDLKQQFSPPSTNPLISSDTGDLFSGASLQLSPR